MRIAITADPVLPVPPREYGGIERMVHLLACGLVDRGHAVTLFAHARSSVPCRHVAYPPAERRSIGEYLRIAASIAMETTRGRYDLVHSFGRLAFLAPILPLPIPKLMTYQRAISPRSVRLGCALSRGSLAFSAVSRQMYRGKALRGKWKVVYNGVSESQYEHREELPADAPLAYLGRIERIKGVHTAIEVAMRAGRRLDIAGNLPPGAEHRRYFADEIAPYLDEHRIRYLGPVDDTRKSELLGGAAALLMPVQWEEPFGIVMAEALACGTPIIGLGRGAVPEVVEDGVNGFVCESAQEMIQAVGRLESVSRRRCRRTMEERFSARAMVDAYEAVYFDLMNRGGPVRRMLHS